MGLFRKLGAIIGGTKPIDELARAYPIDALDAESTYSPYPPKSFLGDKAVYAHRTEFMVGLADAARVIEVIGSDFDLAGQAPLQDGSARRGLKAVHFSLRHEFGGAVVTILTNTASLLSKIDSLKLRPPPPWVVFPEVDPESVGSLQGSLAYWWEWWFLPFWRAADFTERQRYLEEFDASPEWRAFLELHE